LEKFSNLKQNLLKWGCIPYPKLALITKEFIMKNILAILFGSMALSAPLPALLPPLYQSTAEIKAILSDEKLSDVLQSGDLILDIKRTDNGYLIVTNQREVEAQIVYKKNHAVGPAKFDIVYKAH
jgi:hypothetical protein